MPVIVAILIAINTVLSLIAIISIYREGGILKRLRATPLRPWTILTAHVLVKLLLTTVTLALMLLVGRRYFPAGVHLPVVSFAIALMITTWSILSIGFLIASVVPTARFAQPVGAIVLYPMFVLSGLFIPREVIPPWLSHLPLNYAVSLLEGIWTGEPWSAHVGDVVALGTVFAVCTALSAKLFRWEWDGRRQRSPVCPAPSSALARCAVASAFTGERSRIDSHNPRNGIGGSIVPLCQHSRDRREHPVRPDQQARAA